MGIMESVVGGIILILVVALISKARRSRIYKDWICRRALRRLFDIPNEQSVNILVPRWKAIAEETKQVSLVAYEDMLAANLVMHSLIDAGCREKNIRIITFENYKEISAEHLRENLVVLCSPRRNEVTNDFLKRLDNFRSLDYPFIDFPEDRQAKCGKFYLRINQTDFHSQSYQESTKLMNNYPNANPYECGTLHDHALIAMFPNLWELKKRAVLLAGIRAFGTWGTAYALRNIPSHLYKLTKKKKDFAAVVECEFSELKIGQCEFKRCIEIFTIPEVAQKRQ